MLCSVLYECVHIMDCPICYRCVLNHARKINCCHCDKVYHMKCISIVPEEMEAINNNSSELICKNCLMHIFPFNSINDDSEFIQLCSNKQKHGCQISDLPYNPYDSNSEESRHQLLYWKKRIQWIIMQLLFWGFIQWQNWLFELCSVSNVCIMPYEYSQY